MFDEEFSFSAGYKKVASVKWRSMNEIIFIVEEAAEGGYTARSLGTSIFTEADTIEQLHESIRDAVKCHFEVGEEPKVIRLHFVKEELLAV